MSACAFLIKKIKIKIYFSVKYESLNNHFRLHLTKFIFIKY
jgi:hypothetical protein